MTDDRPSTADLVADDQERTSDADQPVGRDSDALDPLFPQERTNELSERWHSLQARFVDDPRETVAQADSLVAELLKELARGFSDARQQLEEQWSKGDDVSTEDLRVALQRYRSFFRRLLSA
jgi:hypothetical protein